MNRTRILHMLRPAVAAGALGGCMVGPDYKGPPDAAPVAEHAPAFHRATASAVAPTPPLAIWWTALGDATLNTIEAQALRASPTLAAAEARVRNARATLHERQTDLLPAGGASALYQRTHLPDQVAAGIGGITSSPLAAVPLPPNPAVDLYSVALDASWQIDIFGGTRRRIESARASADYEQAEMEDAQVTLTADVARAYVNLRDSQRRLGLALDNTALQQRMVDLTRRRRGSGTASDLDVDRLVTQLKQTQSQVPTLQAQVEIYTDQLAQLSGQEPGALDAVLAEGRPIPTPPTLTAIGDPAAMLRHRPDIRAAERRIAADNALIGASVAQYFPSVTLLGTVGYTGTQTNKLFAGNALTYLAGPSISWNIFNFPRISTEVAEARASTEEARQIYRRTVLSALLDAENSLSRFGHQREDVVVLAEAEAAARHSSELSNLRLAAGTSSLIDTLDIERQRIDTQSNLAQGQAQLTTDWVALQSSLGLGWGGPQMVATK